MSLSSIDWREPGIKVSNQLTLNDQQFVLEMMKNAQIQNIGKSNMTLLTRLKTVDFLLNSTLKMKIFKQPGPAFWCTQGDKSARQCPVATNGILKSNTDIFCAHKSNTGTQSNLHKPRWFAKWKSKSYDKELQLLAPLWLLLSVWTGSRGPQSTSTGPKSCTGTAIPSPR